MPAAEIPTRDIALALRGALLTPLDTGGVAFEPDGLLLGDRAGCIAYAGSARRARFAGPVRDVRPGLILPGFVDAHGHFPQARIIGRATGPLLDWLKTSVFPEEARFSRPAYARQVAVELCDRLIACGTTTAALYSSSSAAATEILFQALGDRGLRAVVGLTLMDRACPKPLAVPAALAMRQSGKLIAKWHGFDRGRLRFAITPRFALSCSRSLLRAAGELARQADLPVQTHLAENPREGALTLRAHPYAKSYLDVYDQAGLVGPRTVLAHAIHLRARDWDAIAAAGAAVAHCPDSNFFLGSGRMNLGQARARAIPVGLGSDVAAGRSFSMRRAMASAYDNALALGEPVAPVELLRLATLGGAQALGCGSECGSLQVGKDADAIVVPLPRPAATLDEALAALIFDNDEPRVKSAYVRGQLMCAAKG